ncbi:hypothetical protein DRW03_24395 [Corallococcus sp. H22C18031201]|nr:hypothetical protein DRW03_24395 [Corallococcus sp. H22C18031201]
MSGFGPSTTTAQRAAPDPTKHVNYVLGMVLGVDDFTQEFAYLSERDRWLARDLLGYGTAWGLAITAGLGSRGPEVRVAPGVALSPRGQLVRVTPAQCASLNDWLLAQGTTVDARVVAGVLRLWVVLSYRDCETDSVPVPGEPCRTEDDSMAPSRRTDDFKLEFRLAPPEEPTEEQAVRDLVRWLRAHMEVVPDATGTATLADLLTALRAAVVQPSPLSPETDWLLDTSPAAPLRVYAGDVESFLRAALRVWATELRALWRPNWLGEAQGCQQPVNALPASDVDCVLLAAVDVPVVKELGGANWKVKDATPIVIDEASRPFLWHLRLMQEWALAGLARDTTAVHRPASLPDYLMVAAGTVPMDPAGDAKSAYNGLKAYAVGAADGKVSFTFNGYANKPDTWQYVIKPLLVANTAVQAPTVYLVAFDEKGFTLQVFDKGLVVPSATLIKLQVVLEVSQYFLKPVTLR